MTTSVTSISQHGHRRKPGVADYRVGTEASPDSGEYRRPTRTLCGCCRKITFHANHPVALEVSALVHLYIHREFHRSECRLPLINSRFIAGDHWHEQLAHFEGTQASRRLRTLAHVGNSGRPDRSVVAGPNPNTVLRPLQCTHQALERIRTRCHLIVNSFSSLAKLRLG